MILLAAIILTTSLTTLSLTAAVVASKVRVTNHVGGLTFVRLGRFGGSYYIRRR